MAERLPVSNARIPAMGVAVSIVLATRNRAASLARTLDSLERQKAVTFDWNVIVADDASTDETAAVLSDSRRRLRVIVVRADGRGGAAARNSALDRADADLVVLTDDDVDVAPYWLSDLWSLAGRWPGHAIFGGPIVPRFPSAVPHWLAASVLLGPLFTGFAPRIPEGPLPEGTVPLGPNAMIRRAPLGDVRFDATLGPGTGRTDAADTGYAVGADVDFALRCVARSGPAIYSPKAAVRHYIRAEQLEARWLRRRAFCWGRGVAHLFPDDLTPRVDGVPVNVAHWLETTARQAEIVLRSGERAVADPQLEIVLFWEFVRGLEFEERRIVPPRNGVVRMPAATTIAIRRRYAGLAVVPAATAAVGPLP